MTGEISREGPAARMVAAANAVFNVIDGEGRTLELRRPTALDRLRVLRAAGPVGAANDRYLGMAMLAACVVGLDGVPLPFPASETMLEAAVARLGDAGIAAAAAALASTESPPVGN